MDKHFDDNVPIIVQNFHNRLFEAGKKLITGFSVKRYETEFPEIKIVAKLNRKTKKRLGTFDTDKNIIYLYPHETLLGFLETFAHELTHYFVGNRHDNAFMNFNQMLLEKIGCKTYVFVNPQTKRIIKKMGIGIYDVPGYIVTQFDNDFLVSQM